MDAEIEQLVIARVDEVLTARLEAVALLFRAARPIPTAAQVRAAIRGEESYRPQAYPRGHVFTFDPGL